jgi:hypothetical protein
VKQERIARVDVRWISIAAIGALTALAAYLFWPGLYPLDDAYITLSNARVFLSGQPDPVYHTSYLTGATSSVHLLLVAMTSLVMKPIWGPLVIGLAGGFLYLLALSRIADREGVTGWLKLAVLAIGGITGFALIHYVNGLETSLAMAVPAWMLLWCDDRRKLPLLAGVAPFIRPELGLLSALLLLRLSFRSSFRENVTMALFVLLAAAPWAAWVFSETGRLVPSTIGAKLAWFHPPEIGPFLSIQVLVEKLITTAQLPLMLGLVGLTKVPAGRFAALFILLGLATATVILPSILEWNFARYQAIFTPVLVVGIIRIAADRSRISNIVILGLVGWAICTAAIATRAYTDEIEYSQRVRAQAQFVARLPASSIVLIHDAGQAAWESPKARLIDVVGLKSPEVIPVHEQLTKGECKRAQSLDRIARGTSASHVVVLNRWAWPCVAHDLQKAGWGMKPIYKDLYFVYELTPPVVGRRQPS